MTIDNQLVALAYTVYSKLNPADKPLVDINVFANECEANLSMLQPHFEGISRAVPTIQVPTTDTVKAPSFDMKKSESVLQSGVQEAAKVIEDKNKLEDLLENVKEKMKVIPKVGGMLTYLPTMFKLVTSYVKGEYTDIPKGKLTLIVSAMIYVVSPIDIIPDTIPVIGWLDDMGVIAACVKFAGGELDKYMLWRDAHKQTQNTAGQDPVSDI